MIHSLLVKLCDQKYNLGYFDWYDFSKLSNKELIKLLFK